MQTRINVEKILSDMKESGDSDIDIDEAIRNINIGTYLRSDYESVINDIYKTCRKSNPEITNEEMVKERIRKLYEGLNEQFNINNQFNNILKQLHKVNSLPMPKNIKQYNERSGLLDKFKSKCNELGNGNTEQGDRSNIFTSVIIGMPLIRDWFFYEEHPLSILQSDTRIDQNLFDKLNAIEFNEKICLQYEKEKINFIINTLLNKLYDNEDQIQYLTNDTFIDTVSQILDDDDMSNDFIKYTIMYGAKFSLSFIVSYIMYGQQKGEEEETFSDTVMSTMKGAKGIAEAGFENVKNRLKKKEEGTGDKDRPIIKETAGNSPNKEEEISKKKNFIMQNTIMLYNILDNNILKHLEIEFLSPTRSDIDEHLTRYKVNDAQTRASGLEKILSAKLNTN